MEIQITETVRLKGVEREWQLQRLKMRKPRHGGDEKVPTWEAFRYYTSLAGAAKACAEYDLRVCEDLKDFQRRIDRLAAAIPDITVSVTHD